MATNRKRGLLGPGFRMMFAFAVAALVLVTLTPRGATAQEPKTVRLVALMPKGSVWDRTFRAWATSVKKESGGRLILEVETGTARGDEDAVLNAMNKGEVDGALFTSMTLAKIAKDVQVLQAPGLFKDYQEVDRAREALSPELQNAFEKEGYVVLGWTDFGRSRLFSRTPIAKPADLKGVRVWAWKGNTVAVKALGGLGAKPVELEFNAVLEALKAKQVDAFPLTSYAAISLQWYSQASYVTAESQGVALGATVFRKATLDALPEDLRGVLQSTAKKAHDYLTKTVRKADDDAYAAALKRGLKAVENKSSDAEWARVSKKVRTSLAPAAYSKAILQKAESIQSKREQGAASK